MDTGTTTATTLNMSEDGDSFARPVDQLAVDHYHSPSPQQLLTTSELIELYLLYGESRGYRKATLDIATTAFSYFLTFLEEAGRFVRPASEVFTQAIIDQYRLYLVRRQKADGEKLSPVTINTYLRTLNTLIRWAVRREYLSRAPVVEMVRHDRTGPKPTFTEVEFTSLMAAAEKESSPLLKLRARAIIMLLHDTGIRAGELCRSKMSDLENYTVDGEEGYVIFIRQPSKRGVPRHPPFSNETWLAIKEYRAELARPHGRGRKKKGADPVWLFTSTRNLDEPMTVYSLRRMCERLEERCGVHNNPHAYRRFWAGEWMNNSEGQALDTLGEIGGWKDLRTIKEHYGRYRAATLIRAARRYSAFSKGGKGNP